jgi:hypothetical protein
MLDTIIHIGLAFLFGLGLSSIVSGAILLERCFYSSKYSTLKLGAIGFTMLSLGFTFVYFVLV